MSLPRVFVLPSVAIGLAALLAGCSPAQDKAVQGSIAVKLRASNDPAARLLAANVTIADVEARKTDGTWVPFEGGFPTVVDLLALAHGGGSVNLPTDLLPEGQFTALQLRIDQVELTLPDDTRAAIGTAGTGWVALIPVDFGVVTGQETIVSLTIPLDRSLNVGGGRFEFEPEIEVEGVEHD